ncbi:radical SAM protein [Massilia horti]|uniref:Radical SAM protein n=1 Tax=Massilia horti TaxID=2562153 RepID=A0A4Y9SXD8_9BURK|nr:radical SAM protein [Massilia horti]TFW31101.1 radical SAM protein [Massilia horti]
MSTPLPRFVQIEPVGQCNLRCRMCPVQFRPDGQHGPAAFMPYDTFRKLLDQFEGLAELHLQGLGEPLLHPRFFDMVQLATARGIAVSTNSNLTVLTEEQAVRCVRSGLSSIHVSIDAASAAAYEAIRVRARFDKVLRNLRRLVEARERLGSLLPRIPLVAVLMRRNLDQLPALVRLAAREGAESLAVQQLCHDFGEATLPARYLPMRDFVDAEMLTEADRPHAEDVFNATRAEAERLGLPLKLPRLVARVHAPDVPGPQRCDWPWRGAYVSYDGKAMPCCMVATPDRINFGDMAARGVADIWHGAAYEAFRDQLSSPTPPAVCASCAIYKGTF